MKARQPAQTMYEIRVEGSLGDMWADWFEGFSIRRECNQGLAGPVTVLYGPIPDQPALHGILARIRDLNLTLISVHQCPSEGECNH